MADQHVRARCTVTGAVASLPKRALDLGHIKNWVEVDGPAPKRPKSVPKAFSKSVMDSLRGLHVYGEANGTAADGESANIEEE